MKKKINCFIPFGNPKDTIQTVKELQASELVNKIYLLSADTNKECLPGCECLLINGLYSTSTIKTIADNADDASITNWLTEFSNKLPLLIINKEASGMILISVRCFYSIPKFSPLLQVFWRKQFSNMLHFMKCV